VRGRETVRARPDHPHGRGSAFFDLAATRLHNAVAPQGVEVVIRSGCYLTHDSKSYRDMVARLLERMPAAKSLART